MRKSVRWLVLFLLSFGLAHSSAAATNVIVSVGNTATLVSPAASDRSYSLQNLGTQAVFCGFDNTVTTAANFFVVLRAGTANNDGTGGSVSLSNAGSWYGQIYCIVAAGSANVARGSY